METLLIYLAKVNIALALFYLLYLLFFRKDTFIRIRRYYFLSAIIFSLSYPIMNVTMLGNLINMTPETVAIETSVYIAEISMGEMIVDDAAEATTPIDWMLIGKNILLIGVSLLSLRFLCQLFSIIRIKSRSEKRSLFGYLFHQLKDEITPFSFFSWIFIHTDTHTEKELKQILLHEHTHVRQWHSLDILLAELLRIAFWWNPVVWVMKRDIAINLEYLADQAVLQEGVESTEYQYHLLQMTNHETAVQIVNNFNVSQLKQRIIMMNSEKSPMRKLTKYLSILPLALLLITANSVYAQQNEPKEEAKPPQEQDPVKKESKSDEIFVVVEKQPSFKGNVKAMMEFIEKEMKYPVIAKENGIQGRVIVNYIIEKDGSLSDVQIVRGVDPSLDKEAIRIIEAMPKWNPGLQRDERVRVRYTLPISFKLDENEDTSEMTTVSIKILKDKERDEVIVRGYDSMNKASRESLIKKLENGNPLYIVDDVKMIKGFRLNSIIPTKIESISVLKDKSALEVYGEEGKDGVILITLKDKTKTPTKKPETIDSKRKSDRDDVFMVVENQPEFPGGVQALMKFLGDNIKYPVEAHKNGIEGRVITSFIVNKDGSVSDIEIVRGVDPLLDAEAIRVIEMMPLWKPGTQKEEAVNVSFKMPVIFRLSLEDKGDNKL
ncbi:MAG: TonB family protein [Dysgonamonadaceae bacterium]|nr:TonB family protein [Dysgonamonadaceae bacterium]